VKTSIQPPILIKGEKTMKTSQLARVAVVTVACSIVSTAQAITWGEQDLNGEYPNVAFLRGIEETTPPIARFNCSGSLLHIDADKVVVLTAAHCTDIWKEEIAARRLDTVGVSFDQDNLDDQEHFPGLTRYVRGGVPISLPEKDAPFEKLDYGLVVFSTTDRNPAGQTIQGRWGGISGALTPVQVPPDEEYVPDLLDHVRHATALLSFTAVGYGTGERFPIPGEETGPADPSNSNTTTSRIRYIANRLSYNAYNPVNDVLRLSQNIAKGENGTCTGDSGGPIFYEDADLGRVQVSLISGGDDVCRATNTGPGFSRQEAFDFLSCGNIAGDASAVIACVESRFGVASTPQ
jgi:hypothetical protein